MKKVNLILTSFLVFCLCICVIGGVAVDTLKDLNKPRKWTCIATDIRDIKKYIKIPKIKETIKHYKQQKPVRNAAIAKKNAIITKRNTAIDKRNAAIDKRSKQLPIPSYYIRYDQPHNGDQYNTGYNLWKSNSNPIAPQPTNCYQWKQEFIKKN